ncbi:3-hydroxyacyl-CoA dehydrogenase family protein [Rhizohabitans arisaemae]|uniref:3-hydroxyacyl-CoA dehydrogenase family protein n=1 Tax=Rhizohabitans arisaemae TaxID=2720610 RepID=UPI0024B1FF06|nr:3-hydroxyacyl-CoA dehydrogenase family protein [Rhizohabitans arisaemae]
MSTPAVPDTVCVIGGGRMGAGIAQVFAARGAEVSVVESDGNAIAAARARLTAGLAKAAERGALDTDPGTILARVAVVSDLAALPPHADLVVEAVPERPELKVNVLAKAESVVGDQAVLATNTSSISVGELGTALRRPNRFLGMHFFNPVPTSKLVEVVTTPDTDPSVIQRAQEWVRGLGKIDVTVRDSPGFATSRLGVLLGLEAIRMLQEGVADAAAIDTAMEQGYRHPMGPLRSTDLVGLDVRLAIADYLHTRLGDRFAPPRLLRDMVARGELGRKTGRGFYDWS